MSILAALTAKTRSDDELLGEFSGALLRVQVDAAGKAEPVGYTPEEVATSRQILAEFLEILSGVITRIQERKLVATNTHKESAAENVLAFLDGQGKPREKWLEEITRTTQRLRTNGRIETSGWALLEKILDVLDKELARDLVALKKA